MRKQLIIQFLSESVLLAAIAFILSLILVIVVLPYFNEVADKHMRILWASPGFWLGGLGFTILTGVTAGIYPALFLSSFQPVKVLKGTYRVGRYASLPRKIFVVVQFAISVVLIIGTTVVYKQIQVGQNRPIGYDRDGLITHGITETLHKHFEAMRTELKGSGTVVEMTESTPNNGVWNTNGGFDWEDKDQTRQLIFLTMR